MRNTIASTRRTHERSRSAPGHGERQSLGARAPWLRHTRAVQRLILLGVLASACIPEARAGLRGSVVGNGGGAAGGGGLAVNGTAGQAIVGTSGSGSTKVCSGFWCAGGPWMVAVPPELLGGPHDRPELGPPSPNPSTGGTTFWVALPAAAQVRLSVYDLLGRQRRTVYDGPLAAGLHRLYWDAADAAGARGRSGIYFARLLVDGRWVGQRRLVLVR